MEDLQWGHSVGSVVERLNSMIPVGALGLRTAHIDILLLRGP